MQRSDRKPSPSATRTPPVRSKLSASRTVFSRLGAIALPLLALFAGPAAAADLQIYPIRITLDPATPTAVMTIINRGSTDTLLQLSVLSWSQVGPADERLEPTRDILANPGVFLLKGGEQQVARFALRVPQDAKERSYRIVLQEVPRQRVEMGFATVLRMLVPLFVPAPNPIARIDWNVAQAADGMAVTARNTGNVHVQIKALRISEDKQAPIEKPVNIYVLPGASRAISMNGIRRVAPGTTVHVTADSDQGGLSADVRVGAAEGAPVPK